MTFLFLNVPRGSIGLGNIPKKKIPIFWGEWLPKYGGVPKLGVSEKQMMHLSCHPEGIDSVSLQF